MNHENKEIVLFAKSLVTSASLLCSFAWQIQPVLSQGVFEGGGALQGGLSTGKGKKSGQAAALDGLFNSPNPARFGSQGNQKSGAPAASKTTNLNKAKSSQLPVISPADREAIARQGKQASAYLAAAKEAETNGQFEEAIKNYGKSLQIRETYWRNRDPSIPVILTKLGSCYLSTGETSKARSYLDRALGYYASMHGPGSSHRVEPLQVMANLYEKEGNLSKAKDCYLQAYTLQTRDKGESSPKAVELGIMLAQTNKDLGNLGEAAKVFDESIGRNAEAEIVLGPERYRKALTSYKEVLESLSRKEDAERIALKLSKSNNAAANSEKE